MPKNQAHHRLGTSSHITHPPTPAPAPAPTPEEQQRVEEALKKLDDGMPEGSLLEQYGLEIDDFQALHGKMLNILGLPEKLQLTVIEDHLEISTTDPATRKKLMKFVASYWGLCPAS